MRTGRTLHDLDLSLQSGDINGCRTNGKQLLSLHSDIYASETSCFSEVQILACVDSRKEAYTVKREKPEASSRDR